MMSEVALKLDSHSKKTQTNTYTGIAEAYESNWNGRI